MSARSLRRLLLLAALAVPAVLLASGRLAAPAGCTAPAGCQAPAGCTAPAGCRELVGLETYEPIPIAPGATGRIVASTVDVRLSRREGDLIRTSLGTGVVVGRDGLIVTADHVLTWDDGTTGGSVEVVAADGRRATGEVVARVPSRDLAFVRVDLAGLRPATIAPDLSRVAEGDRVIVVGAPHHFTRYVRRGRVLGVFESGVLVEGRDLGTLIGTSAQIRRGFSGGPLADARGRLIGITVGSTEPGEDGRRSAMAVPAQAVADALAVL